MKKKGLSIVGIVFLVLTIYPAINGIIKFIDSITQSNEISFRGDNVFEAAGLMIGAGAFISVAVFFLVIGFGCLIIGNQAEVNERLKKIEKNVKNGSSEQSETAYEKTKAADEKSKTALDTLIKSYETDKKV